MERAGIEVDIICPMCNRYIKTYKGWGWTGISARCQKCGKLIAYDKEIGEFKVIRTPDRTSSGMTFW